MREYFDFKITGFIIGLILISLIVSSLGIFIAGMNEEYTGINGNDSLSKYDHTAALMSNVEDIRNSTDITPPEGPLDIIGSYFSSGYGALKTAWNSFNLFSDMAKGPDGIAGDVDFLGRFKIMDYIYMIILIGLFIGVGVTALLKIRQ